MNKEKDSFFGFHKVSQEEHGKLISQVFSKVASKYDIMNDVMSLGIHHLWKKELITHINSLGGRILDVAGGTGDISKLCYRKAKQQHKALEIIIYDYSYQMLSKGRNNLINDNICDISFVQGDAAKLPFEDNSFDYYVTAFGMRNFSDRQSALKEAKRVLKPAGKFLCLEFSKVQNPLFNNIYKLYSKYCIPQFGAIIANDKDSYQYLVDSIEQFPSQQEFLNEIHESGLKNGEYMNLSNGITAIHWAYKI